MPACCWVGVGVDVVEDGDAIGVETSLRLQSVGTALSLALYSGVVVVVVLLMISGLNSAEHVAEDDGLISIGLLSGVVDFEKGVDKLESMIGIFTPKSNDVVL